jgi:uncharacterized membrane protein YcaP (DUF421 family)
MDALIRALVIYGVLLLIVRVSGKRNLGELSAFDFVLMIVIAETVSSALHGEDISITKGLLLVGALTAIDVALSLAEHRSDRVNRLLNGLPLVILADGRPFEERLRKERLDVTDILSAARVHHGLERLDQIKFAVLERDGVISVIPKAR